jgi:2-phospho-L-lactate guanylyltransferase
MKIPAVIPFKPRNPKTRLSCVLSQEERERFAMAMLADVVEAVRGGGCSPRILSTERFGFEGSGFRGAPVTVNPAGLNEALNPILAGMDGPCLIVMADLPLLTPEAVRLLTGTHMMVAIAPGRGGGTNAIYLAEASRFHVDYYGASFLKHLAIARQFGLSCEMPDSFRLHTDVDEKEDLVELLIHGSGESRRFLDDLGFTLLIERGRVGVARNSGPAG